VFGRTSYVNRSSSQKGENDGSEERERWRKRGRKEEKKVKDK
jgi:hypothetical protein